MLAHGFSPALTVEVRVGSSTLRGGWPLASLICGLLTALYPDEPAAPGPDLAQDPVPPAEDPPANPVIEQPEAAPPDPPSPSLSDQSVDEAGMTTAPSSPVVDPNSTPSSPVELPHSSWRSPPTHSTSSDSSSGGQQPGPSPPVHPSRPILKPATLPPPAVTESPNVSIPPPQRLPGHLFTCLLYTSPSPRD